MAQKGITSDQIEGLDGSKVTGNISGSAGSVTGTVAIAQGGTNITTYATGDILYASATNTLSKLAAGTNTHVLTLAAGVPTWAAPAGATPGGSDTQVQFNDGGAFGGDAGLTYNKTSNILTVNSGQMFVYGSSSPYAIGVAYTAAANPIYLGSETGGSGFIMSNYVGGYIMKSTFAGSFTIGTNASPVDGPSGHRSFAVGGVGCGIITTAAAGSPSDTYFTGNLLKAADTYWYNQNGSVGGVIQIDSAGSWNFQNGTGVTSLTTRFSIDTAGVVTATARVNTTATTTASAGLRLPHGTAPSSPVDGDVWTTTTGMYARVNGGTVGPFGAASPAGSDTQIQFNDGGAFGGDADFTWNKTTNVLTLGGSGPEIRAPMGGGATDLGVRSSTTNGPTYIDILANGTSVASGVVAWGKSSRTDAAYLSYNITATECRMDAGRSGSGTALPLAFYTGGFAQAFRVHTNQNVRFGSSTVDPSIAFQVDGAAKFASTLEVTTRVGINTSSAGSYNASANQLVVGDGATAQGITIATGAANYGQLAFADGTTGDQQYRGIVAYNHTTDSMELWTAAAARVTIDSSGNSTFAGNLSLSGAGRRIRADYTNATIADRALFQSSVTNDPSAIGVIPNGTANIAALNVFNNSTPTNSAYGGFAISGSEVAFDAGRVGSGTVLPMIFRVGTSLTQAIRIFTGGNVNIGTSTSDLGAKLYVEGTITSNAAITGAGISSTATTNTFTDAGARLWFGPSAQEGFLRSGSSLLVYAGNTNVLTFTGSAITAVGRVDTAASVVGGAGLRIPHGTAPSSPVDGDVWTTTAGLYARINGGTVGPFGAGGGTPAGADTQIQYNNSGSFGASSKFTWNDSTRTLSLGHGTDATASTISMPAQATLDTAGQALTVKAGDGNGNGLGGNLALTAGAGGGSNAAAGAVNINGGTGGATAGAGGAVNVTGGSGNNAVGGSLSLTGGTSTNSTGGSVTLTGGTGLNPGYVLLQAGGTNNAAYDGAHVYLRTGAPGASGLDGNVVIQTAAGAANLMTIFGETGNVNIGTTGTDPSAKLRVEGTFAATDGTGTSTLSHSSGNATFGPTSNHSLALRTNNTARVTITAAGSIDYGSRVTELKNTDTSAATTTIDCATGNVFVITMAASITTLTLNNVPATGRVYSLTLFLAQNGTGGYTVTWPGAVKWPSGTAPTLSAANKVDVITLITHDGGTVWYGFVGGLNF